MSTNVTAKPNLCVCSHLHTMEMSLQMSRVEFPGENFELKLDYTMVPLQWFR